MKHRKLFELISSLPKDPREFEPLTKTLASRIRGGTENPACNTCCAPGCNEGCPPVNSTCMR